MLTVQEQKPPTHSFQGMWAYPTPHCCPRVRSHSMIPHPTLGWLCSLQSFSTSTSPEKWQKTKLGVRRKEFSLRMVNWRSNKYQSKHKERKNKTLPLLQTKAHFVSSGTSKTVVAARTEEGQKQHQKSNKQLLVFSDSQNGLGWKES